MRNLLIQLDKFCQSTSMSDSRSARSPRQCGRPLTYEEKWMIHHVFEVFQQHKRDQTMVVVDDPYSITSQYTGVSRTKVAQIAKAVRQTGTVPPLNIPGNPYQPTAIPVAAEERIRDFVFERHRAGAVCNATHIGDCSGETGLPPTGVYRIVWGSTIEPGGPHDVWSR